MRPALLVACLLTFAACTSAPPVPTEALDRDTGATVTSPSLPLIFAPSRQNAVAQFAYVTLAAVDVNQNSRHEPLLLAYFWISGQDKDPDSAVKTLRLVADDQVIELQPDTRSPRDFGVANLPHAPAQGFALPPVVYRCDPVAWRLLASARELSVQVGSAQNPWPRYELWNEGQPALRQMLEHLQP